MRQEYKHLYAISGKIERTDAPELNFLTVDGAGDPYGSMFQEAIDALYRLAYPIKFALRNEQTIDYPVMTLERLW